jgi:hypothetical protein
MKKRLPPRAHHFWVRLQWSVYFGAFAGGLVILIQRYSTAHASAVTRSIVALFGTPMTAILPNAYRHWPLAVQTAIASFFGFLLGSYLLGPLWKWIYERIVARLDEAVVGDLPSPLPFDPLFGSGDHNVDSTEQPLPYRKLSGCHSAWEALVTHVHKGCPDGRHTLFGRPKDKEFIDLRWILLVGRPGTGKTRMAIEFLLEELGHRRELQKMSLLRRTAHRIAVRWRNTWPTAKRLHTDEWDVGWIRPSMISEGSGYEGRRDIHPDTLEAIKAWKPRRPTALLLDDPSRDNAGQSDVGHVIEALRNGQHSYRFPVRLIVVSQSVDIETDDSTFGGIVELDDTVRFTPDELLELANDPHVRSNWRDRQRGSGVMESRVSQLYQITDGNPMLVDMGFHDLLSGKSLDRVTAPDLIRERAKRVRKALTNAYGDKLTHRHWLTLASTTLAGGMDFAKPGDAILGRDQIEYAKVMKEIDEDLNTLRTCFSLSNRETLPILRPRCLSDAFVRLLFEDARNLNTREAQDRIRQEQLKAAHRAWRLSPVGMLATVSRTAANTDELGEAIRQGPPTLTSDNITFKLNPRLLAMAYVTAAAQQRVDQPTPSDMGVAGLNAAIERIRHLQGSEIWSLVSDIIALRNETKVPTKMRPTVPFICAIEAAYKAVRDTRIPLDTKDALEQFQGIFSKPYNGTIDAVIQLGFPHWYEHVSRLIEALAESFESRYITESDSDIELTKAVLWIEANRFYRVWFKNEKNVTTFIYTNELRRTCHRLEKVGTRFRTEDCRFDEFIAEAASAYCVRSAALSNKDECVQSRKKVLKLSELNPDNGRIQTALAQCDNAIAQHF